MGATEGSEPRLAVMLDRLLLWLMLLALAGVLTAAMPSNISIGRFRARFVCCNVWPCLVVALV
jgi:hypothetical protein